MNTRIDPETYKLNGDEEWANLLPQGPGYDHLSHNGPQIEPLPGPEPLSFILHWRRTEPK